MANGYPNNNNSDGRDYGVIRAASAITKARLIMEKAPTISGANPEKLKDHSPKLPKSDDKPLKGARGDNPKTMGAVAKVSLNTKDAKGLKSKNAPKVRGENAYGAKHDGEFAQGSDVLDKRAAKSGSEAKLPPVDGQGNPKIKKTGKKDFLSANVKKLKNSGY